MKNAALLCAVSVVAICSACPSGGPPVELPYLRGIGWLSELRGKSLAEIRKSVDPQRFVVLGCEDTLPPDVPTEIRSTLPFQGGHAWHWQMNETGNRWEDFYNFAAEAYRARGQCPSFIYERAPTANGTRYIPRVILHLDRGGICTIARERWCRVVRDDRRRFNATRAGTSEKHGTGGEPSNFSLQQPGAPPATPSTK